MDIRLTLILFLALAASINAAKRCKGKDKVVNGKQATPGQFPWQVTIQSPTMQSKDNVAGHFCGGTIVAPNIILTAAHCVSGDDAIPIDKIFVVAGEHDLRTAEGPEQRIQAEKAVVHEKYHGTTNDVALIKLKSNIDLSKPTARAMTLAKANKDPFAEPSTDFRAYASGWGSTTNADPYEALVSPVLLYTNFTVVKGPEKDQICGKGDDGSNVCSGDSGGPYVCHDTSGKDFLCGVSSYIFGSPDGDSECKNGYVCFASVSYQRAWIDKNMKKLSS